MSPLIVLGICFLTFLIIGAPIFVAIGLPCAIYILLDGSIPLVLIPQRIFTTVDSSSLLAIPLFMLSGELMNSGGITKSILNFCTTIVGHIRGGLAHISILTCMLFAGMCGSCAAAASSVGSMMIPALRADRYDDDFIGAVIASGAVLGPIIPPSIIMVVYASISGASVAKLFLGGIAPGILIGVLLMVTAYIISIKRGYKPKYDHLPPMKTIGSAFLKSLPALILPFAIMGGIMSGKFTATEAGAMACCYAAALGFITRELHLRDLMPALIRAGKSATNILLLMATGSILGWILTKNQVPQTMTKMLLGITTQPVALMLIIIAFVLFLGCFLTDATIVPLLTPLLLPVIQSIGFDQIAFGVILCVMAVLGNLTPPVGGLLFVVSGIGKIPVMSISKAVLPFLAVIVFVMVLCTIFPGIISFIPNALMG